MFSEVGQREASLGPLSRALLRLGLLGMLLLFAGGLWMATSPKPWSLLAEHLVRDLPGRIEVQDIDLTGPGQLWDPDSWEITLLGLRWTPDDPTRPAFSAERVACSVPDWEAWNQRQEVHLAWARVVGLDLHLPTQRPPPPWEPTDRPLKLRVDHVEAWDAALQVEEDGLLPALTAGDVYAEFQALSFQPGTRDLTGLGQARIGALQYGDLTFSSAEVGSIVADSRGVVLDQLDFGLAGGEGLATLHFEGLLKTASSVALDATVTSLNIQDIIQASSDRPSPVYGRVSATASLQSDPDAEKGSGVLTAQVRIPELFIPLDIEANSLAPVLRGVLEIFGYRQGQGLRIKNLHGPIRLGPGWVLVDGLRSTVLGVSIEVRSRIDEEGVWILVRRLPRQRTGLRRTRSTGSVGLVIEGPHDPLWLRLAHESEMTAGRRMGPFLEEGVRIGE